MTEQWPIERHAETRETGEDTSFKTARDFLNLLNLFPHDQHKTFNDVVIWIVEKSGDISELEQQLAPVADEFESSTVDSHTLLMTLACAAALANMPSLRTWGKVNAFKYNSWELENWLSEAMIAYAEVHPSACDAYANLAKEAFSGLESFSLQSESERTNAERIGAWNGWGKRQGKLEEIWWDLRGWHGFMNYQEELPLFQVFYKLEPDEFIRTISKSDNPYLVNALLFVAGIGEFSPRFSEWKRMIAAAPVAFEHDGKWNGSVLVPLLLVDARNQLLQVRSSFQYLDVTTVDHDEIEQEITNTAELIVGTVAERKDAAAIFSRWASWLIRKILGQSEKEIADVKSSAFADNALVDAIGRKLGNRVLPQSVPDDAPLWEAWCYRCALASFAYNGHIQVPAWEGFGSEWRLSPEDWIGDRGQSLREHASLITTLNKEIPGIAANLLAYPIAQSTIPVEAWIHLWNDAIVLREIVEFGDSDSVEDEYSSRYEAGRLLLLLFNIGLAIFDQSSARSYDSNSPEARSLVSLFKSLNFAASEMREIDSTLNHEKWLVVAQHLTIRRMIWEPTSSDESSSSNFQVFKADDNPTVSEILIEANGDVIKMVTILQSLLLNAPDLRLKAALNSSSIDVSSIVQSIRTLNEYHPRKYPIDEAQLKKLSALI
ncbi:hypothetical protein Fbal_2088 [Ferrimonas balearica DSM 9799]|uniref:Uncharacterized protein n=1 Tax=Ferrimonas balearica (strain DSM 9799 / CCM 4581 / KCTC 23876 / PAT) TaxID=550540 RepID=E1SUW4_FERBD|nr:hypothetical protein [Ferrimonas balearica]ADN76291.1 hypothetical protein Fbal_2088 [Ferrimonas balearica DSM 9799]